MSKTKQHMYDINHPATWAKGDGAGLPRVPKEDRVKVCPGCGGGGLHPVKEMHCRKCDGAGVIPLTYEEELAKDEEGLTEVINRLFGFDQE